MLQVFEQSLFLFFKIPYHSCRGNGERRCAQVSLASLQLANLGSTVWQNADFFDKYGAFRKKTTIPFQYEVPFSSFLSTPHWLSGGLVRTSVKFRACKQKNHVFFPRDTWICFLWNVPEPMRWQSPAWIRRPSPPPSILWKVPKAKLCWPGKRTIEHCFLEKKVKYCSYNVYSSKIGPPLPDVVDGNVKKSSSSGP